MAKYLLELPEASTVPVIDHVCSEALSMSDFRLVALNNNIAGIKFAFEECAPVFRSIVPRVLCLACNVFPPNYPAISTGL